MSLDCPVDLLTRDELITHLVNRPNFVGVIVASNHEYPKDIHRRFIAYTSLNPEQMQEVLQATLRNFDSPTNP